MEKLKLNLEKCKGCLNCVTFCPVKAITPSQETGSAGYPVIAVDQSKCIQCGNCYQMCPDFVFEILG